jgi:hypothetical protein
MRTDDIKPGQVCIRPRDGGESWDVFWLDPQDNRTLRRVTRRGEKAARDWADRKKAELERAEGARSATEIPFGDTAAGLDCALGGSWLELLWAGAISVAQNPGSESLQKALSVVAKASSAAKQFVKRQDLTQKDEDVDDPVFRRELVEVMGPRLLAEGVPEREVKMVCRILRGPGAKDEEAA